MTAGHQGPLFIPWEMIIWGAVTFIVVPLLAMLAVILIDRVRWWTLGRRVRGKR